WRLSLVEPGGGRWEAVNHDLYHCLREIRRQVEPAGILVCCQGATRNARPSGLLSDQAGGLSHYKLHRWRGHLPWDLVYLFAPVPPGKVATVAEQDAYLRKVDAYRESVLPFLNPFQWLTIGFCLPYYWLREQRFRWRGSR
ncbi:MAG: hypothetical protein HOV67_29490, partial [Kribbellaceae bacterium]|nr:hypothetical protein [Kribbellaceae bacterium]